MIRPSLFLLAVGLLASRVHAGEEPALAMKFGDWRPLFDGQTAHGWRGLGRPGFPDRGWTIAAGELRLLKNDGRTGGGDLVTDEQFTDFEFSWEWNISERGNSGVKYNLPNPTKGVGCEYQMLDDARDREGTAGKGIFSTASLYAVLAPDPAKKLHPAGEWNESRIIVQGNRVEHWLNGSQVLTYELGSESLLQIVAGTKFRTYPGWGIKTSSPLLLQDHGDEVSFRNLRIRTPPSSAPSGP